MARPQKKAIDYFPLDCSANDSVKYLEAKHGIAGFGILIKLWSKIYSTQGYYCQWDEKTKYLFCKDIGVDISEVEAVLNTCFEEAIFHREVFQKQKVLTSEGVQRRYFKIVKEAKRKDIEINPKIYLLEVNSGINPVNSGGNPENSGNTPVESTQRKVKENKEDKRKEKQGLIFKKGLKTGKGQKEKSSGKKEKEHEKSKSSAKGKYGRHATDELAKRASKFGR